jgi:3'-phosphoadenosine 5'-phosphosulfate sulfotransferase (PAPS reductase)/FAD synthetase
MSAASFPPHPAYRCDGPTLISFSGGRTSAYMLHEILRAHDGVLPDDCHVTFANTGKEREETLRFVHECAARWNVSVRWLEWRRRTRRTKLADRFEEVGYNSAARNGEPFAELIRRKVYLPNSQMRYCTIDLKIRIMGEFMRSLGYKKWNNVIGLRYDEGRRVLKAIDRNHTGKERHTSVMPLAKAKVTVADVRAFWQQQPFDLQLMPHEGNCDLCFLKGRGKRAEIVRATPERADWWIDQEANAYPYRNGNTFIIGEPYAAHREAVLASPMMALPEPDDDDEPDGCGDICEGSV